MSDKFQDFCRAKFEVDASQIVSIVSIACGALITLVQIRCPFTFLAIWNDARSTVESFQRCFWDGEAYFRVRNGEIVVCLFTLTVLTNQTDVLLRSCSACLTPIDVIGTADLTRSSGNSWSTAGWLSVNSQLGFSHLLTSICHRLIKLLVNENQESWLVGLDKNLNISQGRIRVSIIESSDINFSDTVIGSIELNSTQFLGSVVITNEENDLSVSNFSETTTSWGKVYCSDSTKLSKLDMQVLKILTLSIVLAVLNSKSWNFLPASVF